MKKIISILLVVVLAFALSCVAFADYSYDASTGKITGSTEGLSGLVEHYVNGSPEGGATLGYKVPGPGTYEITVYENGVPVNTATVVVPTPVEPTEAPVEPTEAPVEPTEAPVEPTEAPVEPTEAPVEPTKAPVEPTEAPVEPTKAPVEPTKAPVEPTKAPVEPTDKPDGSVTPVEPEKKSDADSNAKRTDANGKDAVPKTGEFDSTVVVIAALSIAIVGFGAVVITKKYGKQN